MRARTRKNIQTKINQIQFGTGIAIEAGEGYVVRVGAYDTECVVEWGGTNWCETDPWWEAVLYGRRVSIKRVGADIGELSIA